MLINTKYFGEVEVEESKIIEFEKGIIGMPEYKRFILIDEKDDKGNRANMMSFLQSVDDYTVAFPVINPLEVYDEYNPIINHSEIKNLGDVTEDNIAMFTSVNVGQDATQITTNLKAPFVINTDLYKGVQVIVENDYLVKYVVYSKN